MTKDDAQMPRPSLAFVIVAAGSGSRLAANGNDGDALPKQFLPLAGRPILRHSFDSIASHPDVSAICIVTNPAFIAHTAHILDDYSGDLPLHIVAGGSTRQASVHNGLLALADSDAQLVAIHDAARPLLSHAMIDALIAAVSQPLSHKAPRAALPLLPIADTVKQVNDGQIHGTIDRNLMGAAQTPQIFHRAEITALHNGNDQAFTDDIGMAEAAGIPIAAVAGDPRLLKITYELDLQIAASLASAEQATQKDPHMIADLRVGNGFDVHKFAETPGPIMLAGISVPSEFGMLAHSDGDVGLHALCDAIFGALADGDIGFHFPPSDAQWKDAESGQFLTYAVDRCRQAGARILHLDLTVICETPKVTPYRDAMRQRIADLCDIEIGRVGVKATTSETLGFTGRGEGIAAQATATIVYQAPVTAEAM